MFSGKPQTSTNQTYPCFPHRPPTKKKPNKYMMSVQVITK